MSKGLNFELWDKHNQWDDLANSIAIDTTSLSINDVAQAINNWITDILNCNTVVDDLMSR